MDSVTKRNRDCTACRIISGGGLLGMCAYMTYSSQHIKGYSKMGLLTLAAGLGGLGFTRLLNLPPFREVFSTSPVKLK